MADRPAEVPPYAAGWCAAQARTAGVGAARAARSPRTALPTGPTAPAGARAGGLTAGASTAPGLADGVVAAPRALGPVEVACRRLAVESATFALPKELSR
ncbi:hypothetical protein ACH4JS_29730 [Streptomyces sp. NPDC017638]|uniref:hypothetical protein n=1 Tax=Streptomyces sp. NPDC017638 TaxID=3365004 RepID=UPI0037925FFE